MEVVLTPIQTKIVLRTLQKLLKFYALDRNSKSYPKKRDAFFYQFSEQDINRLKSLLAIFEQSQGATFCL